MRAKETMTAPVVTLRPDMRVKDAAGLLVERGISGAPVVDAAGAVIGIVSEADLVHLESVPDPRSRLIPRPWHRFKVPRRVEEVMTHEVVCLPPEADVAEIARVMLERRIKRIPIVERGRLVGIVTRRDLIRILARPDEEIERQLKGILAEEEPILGSVRVAVEDGVVTLTGRLEAESRRLAEALVRGVPGVVEVEFSNGP